jgi:thiol-disulfide isomerase/thioredoxin
VRLVAAFVLALGLVAAAPAARSLQAPPLAGIDVITGKHVSLDDYDGRVVVVNVWGSWCGGCIEEARDLAAFIQEHPKLAVLGVDSEDTKAGARAFYRRYGYHHPSIFDPQAVLARRLGLTGYPTTLFLDRQHRIVATVVGSGKVSGFDGALRVALLH